LTIKIQQREKLYQTVVTASKNKTWLTREARGRMCVAQTTLTEINIQRSKYLKMKLQPTKLLHLHFTVGPKIADCTIFFSSPSTISNHKKIFSSTGIMV